MELLERQGRSSQKSRPSSSNLMQVTKLAGQNISDLSQGASSLHLDKRGTSLPPPRNLKPPKKNFGFSGSLNRKEDSANEYSVLHNSNRVASRARDPQTFMQQIQRLSPTKKRSLLPTPARTRPMGSTHQYMPIGRSPSPANFILGRTPTPTPQQGQNNSRNF